MNSAWFLTFASAWFLLAYFVYGRWLSRKVFRLDDKRTTPACEIDDGKDYVPTDAKVVMGHHFTSIAGAGPIVGPAIAVIWGWMPAAVWIIVGSVVAGAVHDFGAMVLSLRNEGRNIGSIAGNVVSPGARSVFFADYRVFALVGDRRIRLDNRHPVQNVSRFGSSHVVRDVCGHCFRSCLPEDRGVWP